VGLAAFVELALFGTSLWGLIAGVVVLDAAVQVGQVCNQTRIYNLLPQAASRANTVYMMSYFLGGALGAAIGVYGWNGMQWTGVCLVGSAMLLIAGSVHWGNAGGAQAGRPAPGAADRHAA
jgi:predicted MFS family arabinose efflux permease